MQESLIGFSTYWSSPGALFYLVKQHSLSLDLPTEVLLYLVEAWVGRVPSYRVWGIIILFFLSSLLLEIVAEFFSSVGINFLVVVTSAGKDQADGVRKMTQKSYFISS